MPETKDESLKNLYGRDLYFDLTAYCGWCGQDLAGEDYLETCIHSVEIGLDIGDTVYNVLSYEACGEQCGENCDPMCGIDLNRVATEEQKEYLVNEEWVLVGYSYSDNPGPHGASWIVTCAVPAKELRSHPKGPQAAINERFQKLVDEIKEWKEIDE